MLLDPSLLARVIPGCRQLRTVGMNAYRAEVALGAGPVRGRFEADVRLRDVVAPQQATLEGGLIGPLGAASGVGHIRLSDVPEGTRADYDYDVAISGKVASIGGRMLQGAARAVIALFFRNLIAVAGGRDRRSWWRSLLGRVTPRHTR